MIRLPLRDAFEPVFIVFSEDPHDRSFRVFVKDVDITDLISNSVYDDCRQEVLRYHAGIKHYRNPDREYDSWKENGAG